MARLPHHFLITLCLAGSLLLLPLYCAGLDVIPVQDYDSTPSPEYDYNATFDYIFFSNGSSDDLEKFLRAGGTDEASTETDVQSTVSTIGTAGQASRTVYPSVLLTLALTTLLLRLL
ncbi:uncharacterized protein LOC143516927 [Brachyhypopomus gauderio]|uniref:uncharacterized protein LOC143516927 n=1 Tax=Brachyhypopomus gauderio TaxID=698409 RepID=UPI00404250FC